jgi:hypothetical protein
MTVVAAIASLAGSTELLPLTANAAECSDMQADTAGQAIGLQLTCSQDGQKSKTPATATISDDESPYVRYEWRTACSPPGRPLFENEDCGAARVCASQDERLWELWGFRPGGRFDQVAQRCESNRPTAYVPPTVTPGMVLSELRRVGLPALEIEIQPEAKTLVNFDTIFHTDPQPVDVNLTILGQGVQVRATPERYVWRFGDGSTLTTQTPGAAYPSKEIVHRYLDADVTVQPSVSVVYGAEFRVGGGGWQDVGGTVTIPGPPEGLRVVEAVGVLSGEHD